VIPETCPQCASQDWIVKEGGVQSCKRCGFEITGAVQVCSLCGNENNATVDRCSNCGEILDVVDHLIKERTSPKNPRWLQEARESAGAIKALEEASSQLRLEKMIEVDRKRQQEILLEKARQDELEKRTLSVTMIGTAVILVIIVIATLVITLRG
jgi:predicted amidophosphoribosyltransferase